MGPRNSIQEVPLSSLISGFLALAFYLPFPQVKTTNAPKQFLKRMLMFHYFILLQLQKKNSDDLRL
jgi:hypothetical protein